MLPAETFGLRKRLLTLSMAKPRQKADVFITYELFIYGDIHYSFTVSKCAENSDTIASAVNYILL